MKKDEIYLLLVPGGLWAISRLVKGRWVHLTQDSYLENPADAEAILLALNIPPLAANLNLFFPERDGQGRCPTLELLELCNILDPTNPIIKNKEEYGV